ncbi:hypothetical protein CK203_102570 [Vitis vinifera]|uniref:Neprosin PEP catalytic domain-containing protein n=1 Tax=Vitis vinifera TaxID=29760 RepID=A0A438EH28_VITVI|nr:hypothetical protein CK203_102570 [Vitis vinifera]
MALKKMMSCYGVLVLLIVVDINGVWSISREEDLELERQLKILNKPGVKTIKTDNGEIFNCVDIHKQPSLDHPLLKNHEVQITFDPRSVKEKESPSVLGQRDRVPNWTVPIRRTQKEDLIRAQAFRNCVPEDMLTIVIHLPQNQTFFDYLNIYNPTLSSPDQASTTLIYLAGGVDVSDISVGWTVYEPRYGDNKTHLFTYWTADNGATTGCYDLLCPGFILTNPDFPLGLTLPSSTYRGAQYDLKMRVSKDPKTGHWWLFVADIEFGYWPKQLFSFFGAARELYWGGEVFSPSQPFPPMGSGHFPEEGAGAACFMRALKYQYEDGGAFEDILDKGMSVLADSPGCYKVGPLINRGGFWGITFLFGGPGGQC